MPRGYMNRAGLAPRESDTCLLAIDRWPLTADLQTQGLSYSVDCEDDFSVLQHQHANLQSNEEHIRSRIRTRPGRERTSRRRFFRSLLSFPSRSIVLCIHGRDSAVCCASGEHKIPFPAVAAEGGRVGGVGEGGSPQD